jgi:hypothetical protein
LPEASCTCACGSRPNRLPKKGPASEGGATARSIVRLEHIHDWHRILAAIERLRAEGEKAR